MNISQLWSKAAWRLGQTEDSASLVLYRIGFGLLMFWEITRYFSHDWIRRYWIEPPFLFAYEGFEWIKPWDGNGMYIHFLVMAVLALCIATGLLYRIATVLFFFAFTYVFLLDKTHYLNHFYLISILSGLMIFLPANRRFALDVKLGLSTPSDESPKWVLFLLRAQLAIVYFFGGVAKLNPDWLSGKPMDQWMAKATDFPLIGQFFTEHWMVMAFVYGGLALDLFIVPFLIWRRTRPYAYAIALLFHLLNSRLFVIGVFPWFMIAATTLFFEPGWCKRIIPRFGGRASRTATDQARWALPLITVFLLVQTLLPLRHFLYPGDVNWTEEGHRFSWHMKLRQKRGEVVYVVKDPASGKTWEVKPRKILTKRQVSKMAGRPDMILQFAHYLKRGYAEKGYPDVEVYAHAYASLNGRKPMRELVKSDVNLAAVKQGIKPAHWIWPLDEAPAKPERMAKNEVPTESDEDNF